MSEKRLGANFGTKHHIETYNTDWKPLLDPFSEKVVWYHVKEKLVSFKGPQTFEDSKSQWKRKTKEELNESKQDGNKVASEDNELKEYQKLLKKMKEMSELVSFDILGVDELQLLSNVQNLIESFQKDVRRLMSEVDRRADIPSFLDFESLEWDFESEGMFHYRARANNLHKYFIFMNSVRFSKYTNFQCPEHYTDKAISLLDEHPIYLNIHPPTYAKKWLKKGKDPIALTIKVVPGLKVLEALEEFYIRFYRLLQEAGKTDGTYQLSRIEETCFKIAGERSYISKRENEILQYVGIQDAIYKFRPIHLFVTEIPKIWDRIPQDSKEALAERQRVQAPTFTHQYREKLHFPNWPVVVGSDYQDAYNFEDPNLKRKFSPLEDPFMDRSNLRNSFYEMNEPVLDHFTSFYYQKAIFAVNPLLHPYSLVLGSVENATSKSLKHCSDYESENNFSFRVSTLILCGTVPWSQSLYQTPPKQCALSTVFKLRLTANKQLKQQPISISRIPRSARLVIVLYQDNHKDKTQTRVGYSIMNLVDELGQFVSGKMSIPLWDVPDEHALVANQSHLWLSYLSYSAATSNKSIPYEKSCRVLLEFPEKLLPYSHPLYEAQYLVNSRDLVQLESEEKFNRTVETDHRLVALMNSTPLYRFTSEDKKLFWKCRFYLKIHAKALPRFLESCSWDVPKIRHQIYLLVKAWAKPESIVDVITLLSVEVHDPVIRQYAVDLLAEYDDAQLEMFLVQIVQCLKFEHDHDSPLSRFLLERGLNNPYQLGHYLVWHLKAELSPGKIEYVERYGLILEEYLHRCGEHLAELRIQNEGVKKLQLIAEKVAYWRNIKKPKEELKAYFRKSMESLNRRFFTKHKKFQNPLRPEKEYSSLVVDKCFYLSSKMVPLFLTFNSVHESHNGNTSAVIFKSGDDLRQDILTIQLLKYMEKLWVEEGNMQMMMYPYKVVATGSNKKGRGVGLIEVVPDSKTTSDIQVDFGGAFSEKTLLDYIKQFNKTPYALEEARLRFLYSCAGYAVATYVLGIGDRHNGNIMVTKDGRLFHIDFGHFLGNFKSKFGVKRERSAFCFTPEMAYVIHGKEGKKSAKWKLFLDICCKAFEILRKHANDLINLFVLMIPAGMPELRKKSDINYLQQKLMIKSPSISGKKTKTISPQQAKQAFLKEIDIALKNTFRRFDNMVHNVKHKGAAGAFFGTLKKKKN